MKGLVSVILPVFRRPELLHQALRSVLDQTYPKVEIIVVDDASGEAYVSQYELPPQARFIQLPVNGGPAAARNAGIAAARGEFIAFLDSDDIWLPEKLARQVAVLDAMPGMGLTHCRFERVDGDLNVLPERRRAPGAGDDDFVTLLYRNIIQTPSTVLLRSELVQGGEGFDPSLRYAEDRDLWLRLALEHRFHACGDLLVRYRVHPEQLTDGSRRLGNLEVEARLAEKWLGWVEAHAPRFRNDARKAACRALRLLAKALSEERADPAEARGLLLKAMRIYPWDHRVPLKLLALAWLSPGSRSRAGRRGSTTGT